jgi:hypothetical protein
MAIDSALYIFNLSEPVSERQNVTQGFSLRHECLLQGQTDSVAQSIIKR